MINCNYVPLSYKKKTKPKKKTASSSKKNVSFEQEFADDGGGELIGGSYDEVNLLMNNQVMLPHLLVPWKDKDLQDRLTLWVWALSGLEPIDIKAKILEGGEEIQLTFPWPEKMQDAIALSRNFYLNDSSKVVEIESVLKTLKGGEGSAIVSCQVNFALGMKVEEQFHKEIFKNKPPDEGYRVLRFYKNRRQREGLGETVPYYILKYEFMGIRDSYVQEEPVQDYEDVVSVAVASPPVPPQVSIHNKSYQKKRKTDTGRPIDPQGEEPQTSPTAAAPAAAQTKSVPQFNMTKAVVGGIATALNANHFAVPKIISSRSQRKTNVQVVDDDDLSMSVSEFDDNL